MKEHGCIYILTNPSFPEYVKIGYATNLEAAYELLECIAKISGTMDRLKKVKPEGQEILDEQIAAEIKEAARRGPFNFSACEIPVGAELVYVDDPNVKVKVLDDRHIEYQGETTSLSRLTLVRYLPRQGN